MYKLKKILQKKRFWAGILFAQILFFYIFSNLNFFKNFVILFFDAKKKIQQSIFATLHFSIGDIFYVICGTSFIYLLFLIIIKKNKHSVIIGTLKLFNIFFFCYQILWGALYSQEPIIKKLPERKITNELLKSYAIYYITEANENRKFLKEDKNGVFILQNIKEIKREILLQQVLLPQNFNNKKTTLIDNFKPSIFENFLSYTGILGYYNPFTTEAQYNSKLPSSYIPFTLAHESAHQLGFAREQEANFIAYLICKNSKNFELKYSANLYIIKSLINQISLQDKNYANKIEILLSEKVKKDIENNKIFYDNHKSWLFDFFSITNDLFLKANKQEGVISYSYFIELLIRYEHL